MTVISAHTDLELLQHNLGYKFKRLELLQTALFHSSYINESRDYVKSNERLEFLGDAVVNLAIAQILMETAPELREGKLSAVRATLVNEKGLAEIAAELHLPEMMILGKGEEQDNGRQKKSLCADAMEAVFAAVFLDSNFETVREVVRHVFGSRPKEAITKKHSRDFKTMLQEYLQNKKMPLPIYELVDVAGPDHKRTFTIRLHINEMTFEGSGSNKKKAQQETAKNAMVYFTGLTEL